MKAVKSYAAPSGEGGRDGANAFGSLRSFGRSVVGVWSCAVDARIR